MNTPQQVITDRIENNDRRQRKAAALERSKTGFPRNIRSACRGRTSGRETTFDDSSVHGCRYSASRDCGCTKCASFSLISNSRTWLECRYIPCKNKRESGTLVFVGGISTKQVSNKAARLNDLAIAQPDSYSNRASSIVAGAPRKERQMLPQHALTYGDSCPSCTGDHPFDHDFTCPYIAETVRKHMPPGHGVSQAKTALVLQGVASMRAEKRAWLRDLADEPQPTPSKNTKEKSHAKR